MGFFCSKMSYVICPVHVVGTFDAAPHLSRGRMFLFSGAYMTLFRRSGAEVVRMGLY